MPRARPPINPEVLRWAIGESGYSARDLADSLNVDTVTLGAWAAGEVRPTRGQFTKLAKKLRRPKSIFFLPDPPEASGLPVTLRTAVGRTTRDLSASELLWVRRARRLQRLLSLLEQRQLDAPIALPRLATDLEPSGQGVLLREWAGVMTEEQLGWSSAREAFDAWRYAIEERGVVVMELQLGADGLRGFSLEDEYAPVVAVNMHENVQARTFTQFHELAHLASGSAKACLQIAMGTDRTERWCDEVASAALLPPEELRRAVAALASRAEPDFEAVRMLAREFSVSLRATAMALVRDGLAERSLYSIVEEAAPVSDYEKPQGRAKGGRRTPTIRLREYGPRAANTVLDAVSSGQLGELEARRHLRLNGAELLELAAAIGGSE